MFWNKNQSDNDHTAEMRNHQVQTCCKHIRRKPMLYTTLMVIILIVIICMPIIIIKTRKTNDKQMFTTSLILHTESVYSEATFTTESTTIAEYSFKQWNNYCCGGNEEENENFQVKTPDDVIIDKFNKNALIICDYSGEKVVRWFLQDERNPEIIKSSIFCSGLALDKDGALYIIDTRNNQVIRIKQGEKNETIVAGRHGSGTDLNQLKASHYIYVDNDYSLYISDNNNNRVMKWTKGATQGILFADGSNKKILDEPHGLVMDHLGQLYIVDKNNHRILR
ncbi:unnamed protein product [Adineta ricciae]|uniref:Uncharacterized protein n=1 Tax=Adineta ricciae TaxID=249248 RepID=A0A815V9H0_ADIRI|nr:unnamed protein product [Adineta ricciae]CAF1529170.1 unnamed protein product [Adineta ricciae]